MTKNAIRKIAMAMANVFGPKFALDKKLEEDVDIFFTLILNREENKVARMKKQIICESN